MIIINKLNYDILYFTINTIKSNFLYKKKNIITIKVKKDVKKYEIKNAIKKIFNLVPRKINIILIKINNSKNKIRKNNFWKKAYIYFNDIILNKNKLLLKNNYINDLKKIENKYDTNKI